MKTEVKTSISVLEVELKLSSCSIYVGSNKREGPSLAQCYRIAFGRNFIKVFAAKLYMQEQLQIYML
jgi:hypothetical protein